MEFENNALFWQKIDTLYLSSDLVISRPRNSVHPAYKNLVYPVDYGYLKDLHGENPDHISVYRGTLDATNVSSLVVCADVLKRDIEVKLLVGCNEQEVNSILEFLNQTDFQKSVVVNRGKNIPAWASTI
ncbi:MAG: Inorganic pyrophosphatase [Erysipelotrichaceae bacterium]|jgi:inorganic pyrophosphatase